MASKKDPNNSLPQAAENDSTPSAKITYANEVIAIIAGLAANEVEGIAGMCSISGNYLNKNRNVTKGVKVELGTEEAAVDLFVIVEYGTPIQRAAMDAQENVRKAIESMTGLHVVRVDVHVQGVSFEKEKQALESGLESARLTSDDRQDQEEILPEEEKEPVSEEDGADEEPSERTEDAIDPEPEA